MRSYYIGLLAVLVMGLSCSPKNDAYQKLLTEHRSKVKTEFLADSRSPLTSEDKLAKMSYFPADIDYNCQCEITKDSVKRGIEMPTYSGISRPFYIYGKVNCKIKKQSIELTLYKSVRVVPGHPDLLFLPFKDATNDVETYGGGRYLDLEMHDIHDDKINIDFNKAYNPWCAYSDGYNCPIPPKANHLAVGVYAGEKMYLK